MEHLPRRRMRGVGSSRAQALVGHPLKPGPGPGDGLYAPFTKLSSAEFTRTMVSEFITVLLATFVFILAVLFVAVFLGPPSTGAQLGIQAILSGVFVLSILSALYAIERPYDLILQTNPYLTLVEMFPHRVLGFIPGMIQIVAQAIGTTAAAALVYGVIQAGEPGGIGFGGLTQATMNTTWGWVFGLQAFALGFQVLVLQGNEGTTESDPHAQTRVSRSLSFLLAVTVTILYPFTGVTVHNPFQFLGACILSGTCASDWQGDVFGPLAGAIVASCLHLLFSATLLAPTKAQT